MKNHINDLLLWCIAGSLLFFSAAVAASPVLFSHTSSEQTLDHTMDVTNKVRLKLNNAENTVVKWEAEKDQRFGAHITFECSFVTDFFVTVNFQIEAKSPGRDWIVVNKNNVSRTQCVSPIANPPVYQIFGMQGVYKARAKGTQKLRVKAWIGGADPTESATIGYLTLMITD